MKLIAWRTWAVVQIALLILLLAFPPTIHAALVDTGLVVRYYIDEAASGQGPTSVLDDSVSPDFDLTIDYGGSNLNYVEISGNRGLESTSTTGAQTAEFTFSDTSDKVRDNIGGSKTFTFEIVVRVDDFSGSTGRLFVINQDSGANITIGFGGTSGTALKFYFNEVLMRTIDPGTARAVWHGVVDTALATANDRVKIYKDGTLQSPTIDANPAQDATVSLPTNAQIRMFNRGVNNRSVDGVLFYGSLYSVAMPQADITTNKNDLITDDDTPAAGVVPLRRAVRFSSLSLEQIRMAA